MTLLCGSPGRRHRRDTTGHLLYCPPHGALARAAAGIKLVTCAEGFIDRRYQEDGNLCPRTEVRALIEDADEAASQALEIAIQRTVTTVRGTTIPMEAKSLCVHGDSPNAVELLRHPLIPGRGRYQDHGSLIEPRRTPSISTFLKAPCLSTPY